MFRAIDGALIDSMQYSDSAYAGAIHQWSRNLLIDSSASIGVIFNSLTVGGDIGLQIMKFDIGTSNTPVAMKMTGLT